MANGSAFCCCGSGAGGDVGEEKLRPPKASPRPPKLGGCAVGGCIGGDCIPPKELWRSCCGCACCLGAEAYSDKMDCFRSGRDGPDEPSALPEALKGTSAGAEGGPPKKSKPNSESPCFAGALVGTEAFGGAARDGGSVVLGLAGGVGISPRMSMFCGGLRGGPFG